MFLDKTNASARRIKEAEDARKNRLELVKAHSQGEISRRDMFKWGVFTSAGFIAHKSGLSPFAKSAFAAVPTGTPASPTFAAAKFAQPLRRAAVQQPMKLYTVPGMPAAENPMAWGAPGSMVEPYTKNYSWHEDYNQSGNKSWLNPVTGVGPMEGRPPGPFFAHQRWSEFLPQDGYILSLGQVKENSNFAPGLPNQNENSVWTFGTRTPGQKGSANGLRTGNLAPALIKGCYGEPMVTRIYNDLPVDRAKNGGFGRNEISTHFHNATNGAESDGACNAYHFPGTFYDYHWGMALHRRDRPDLWVPTSVDPLSQKKACGPTSTGSLVQVDGDFREIQGTMWFHDHRFFFTAENVHKGNYALFNMYSGPDRGREDIADGINLQLPSGNRLPYGNLDFDVNLAVTNPAFDQAGQLFFDIFDTEGFLGDVLAVNGTYYPYLEVLPRRYRFRILNASMSRFIKLAIATNKCAKFSQGTRVPFSFIANDGNFVVNPLLISELDEQGVAERYDIIVDFGAFSPGDSIYLVNVLQQTNGRMPDGAVTLAQALKGVAVDPAVGPIMEFRVKSGVESVDVPGQVNDAKAYCYANDKSANVTTFAANRKTLTTQIPIIAPVRERLIEFVRSAGDSRATADGQCIPDCGTAESFPWSVRVNGQAAHSANANKISVLIPKPGEVEHWTLKNGGAGWDHPIHLHFEEGVTMDRGTSSIPATERLARKDVWRLRPGGTVKFQVRFGEFGGSYVSHCHNTVHEDFAMLLRYQLLTPPPGDPAWKGQAQYMPTQTPIPTPSGVQWKTPEILPEGNPSAPGFNPKPV